MGKKQKFLTVYDYEKGGLWQYIFAYNSTDIIQKYSKVQIIKKKPKWLKEFEKNNKLKEYDIDDNHSDLHPFK